MGWLKQHNGDGIKRLSELEERSIKIILSEKYGEKKKKQPGAGRTSGTCGTISKSLIYIKLESQKRGQNGTQKLFEEIMND